MAGIGAREDETPIIRHNPVLQNAMAGIGCRTKACPLIEHNECYENGMAGIGCRTEAEPVIRHIVVMTMKWQDRFSAWCPSSDRQQRVLWQPDGGGWHGDRSRRRDPRQQVLQQT